MASDTVAEVVIDANIALNWLVSDLDCHTRARQLIEECATSDISLIVPPSFYTETDSAIHLGMIRRRTERSFFLSFWATFQGLRQHHQIHAVRI